MASPNMGGLNLLSSGYASGLDFTSSKMGGISKNFNIWDYFKVNKYFCYLKVKAEIKCLKIIKMGLAMKEKLEEELEMERGNITIIMVDIMMVHGKKAKWMVKQYLSLFYSNHYLQEKELYFSQMVTLLMMAVGKMMHSMAMEHFTIINWNPFKVQWIIKI